MGVVSNPSISEGDYPNIILLVLDSVRGDRFTRQEEFNLSTPTLNELAEEGISFENAYSTGSWTIPAHGSLFTGKLPREHGAHAKHKYFDAEPETTLAGKLSSKGYNTVGFSTNPWISDEFGFTSGFDEFYELRSSLPFSDDETDPRDEFSDPSIQEVFHWILLGNPIKRAANGIYAKYFQQLPYAPADRMNEEILSWLSNSSEEPFFLFANYMDAHEPYLIRDNYIREGAEISENVLDFDWNLNCYNNIPKKRNYEKIRDIYDSSISYLDYNLEKLINGVDLENTLLVIAGDHGQALGENDYWGHGTHLSECLVHVPLIVRPPTSPRSLVYDSSDVISLKNLPCLIFSFLGFDQEFPSHELFPESLLKTDVAVAESFGPHQRVDDLPPSISNTGYRMVLGESLSMLHNLDSSERGFSLRPTNDPDNRLEQNDLINYENQVVENIPQRTFDNEEDISKQTKKRLDNLGYM
jgi:hypothetical protein